MFGMFFSEHDVEAPISYIFVADSANLCSFTFPCCAQTDACFVQ